MKIGSFSLALVGSVILSAQSAPPMYARVVELFGREGMVDITLTLGDYAATAMLLNAVDQQLQPGRTVNLPAKDRLAK